MIFNGCRDLLETTGAITRPRRRRADLTALAREAALIMIIALLIGCALGELLMLVLLNESTLLALGLRP